MTLAHRARGLTLIEIVIAIALLALLAVIAVPGFSARFDRERLQGAAEALAADVNEARFEAVRQGKPLHVQVQGGPAWCWSVASTADCPCGSAQDCQLRGSREHDHPGVMLRSQARIDLGPDGRAASLATDVELESARGLRLRVKVGAMGRAHICSAQGDSSRYAACR